VYETILTYKRGCYFKITALILVLSIVLYVTLGDTQPPNGGTWQGYVLGVLGTSVIIYLTFIGIRKRNYLSSQGTLLGWTSAHTYLGMAVIPLATLHSAGQLGWNIHSLAYALACLVVLSGFVGLYFYLRSPTKMSTNLMSKSRDDWIKELIDVNERAKAVAIDCDVDVSTALTSAIERTYNPVKLIPQFFAIDRSVFIVPAKANAKKAVANVDQQKLLDFISEKIPNSIRQQEPARLQELLSLCSRRQKILRLLRRDLQQRASLKIWLLFHVPLSIALLAALIAHILSVFIYW
jgi:hypothetical protein